MKKLGKIIFVCFLCIGIIKGNEGTLQAANGDTFTADIEVGAQLVTTTFKVLSEANGSTKGTVQIGDGTNTAIDRNTAGDMVIPEVVKDIATSNSYDVKVIGDFAFEDCSLLTSTGLESNNTVTRIGGGAFARCTSLESTGLESNKSVTEIGYGVFYGCTSLKSTGLESNTSVTEIGFNAFDGCTSLTSTGLSADSKVTQIGHHAFLDCTNLASFIFKNGSIPTIGINAFPSTTTTYYFEGAKDTGNLRGYDSTKIKVDSIKVLDKTYHEGETFTPNGLKFRIGYSKTSETAEEVFDIVDYNNSKNEFTINEVILKSGINEIDVEYLNEKVTLTLDGEDHTYELKNDETNHWLQCTKDQAIKDKEKHTYGEWIIDKEATLSEDGEKHTLCNVCNNKKTERIPMLSDESSYAITSGSNQIWQKGSKNMVSFTIDAKIENFEGIKIDGKTINKELYTVKSGSMIIELKTEYLNTLNKGKYEIVFVFKGNEVATSFEIIETAVIDNKIPDTGDQTNISLYIGMMILAIGGCIWLKVRS